MHVTLPATQGRPIAFTGPHDPLASSHGGDLTIQVPSSGKYPVGIERIRVSEEGQWAINFDVLRETLRENTLDRWYSGVIHPIHVAANGDSLVMTFAKQHGLSNRQIASAIHVVETDGKMTQGTAFFIAPGLLLTCAHCVGDDTVLVQSNSPYHRYSTTVLLCDTARDIAVLKVHGLEGSRWLPLAAINPSTGPGIRAYGFPRYQLGDSIQQVPLTVTGTRAFHGVTLHLVVGGIVAGMSGCPIMDKYSRVIGIALRGGASPDDSEREEFQGILALTAVWDAVTSFALSNAPSETEHDELQGPFVDTREEAALSDRERLKLMAECFDRPAFTTPFEYESSIPDFKKAITDTIEALNTGVRRTRGGTEISRIPPRNSLFSPELRATTAKLVNKLVELRLLYDRLLGSRDIVPCGCSDPLCPVATVSPFAGELLNLKRKEVLELFREAYPEFTVRPHW